MSGRVGEGSGGEKGLRLLARGLHFEWLRPLSVARLQAGLLVTAVPVVPVLISSLFLSDPVRVSFHSLRDIGCDGFMYMCVPYFR